MTAEKFAAEFTSDIRNRLALYDIQTAGDREYILPYMPGKETIWKEAEQAANWNDLFCTGQEVDQLIRFLIGSLLTEWNRVKESRDSFLDDRER